MGSIGPTEILVILVLALIVLGPDRLPSAARQAGRWLGELRRMTASVQAEVQDVVDEVMRPVHETTSAAASYAAATGGTESTAPETAVASPAEVEVTDPPKPPEPPKGPEPQSAFDPSMN